LNDPLRLGVVCALADEARVFGLKRPSLDREIILRPNLRLWVSGMGAARAGAAAESLLKAGCDALLSFGYCGALSPGLVPGSLVLPSLLVDAESGEEFEADSGMHAALRQRLTALPHVSSAHVLVGSARVLGVEDKRAWDRRWPGAVVDMESCAIARAAREHGVPWGVLRAVLDRRDDEIPSSLTRLLDPWGRWDAPLWQRLTAVMGVSPRRLWMLAHSQKKAFDALARSARCLSDSGPFLPF
jgi:adenosylhomocysteine nucleosidase